MGVTRTSIALATYNGARYLPLQLQSYASQTRLPDELVVSDDGSSDLTEQIVREFAGTAPFPVLFLRNPGARGINHNFESAIRHTSHDIIFLSDQDDQWLPKHVERLAETLEADDRILCVSSNSEVVDDELRPLGYTLEHSQRYPARLHRRVARLPANQLELITRHRIVAGHGLAFRRQLLPVLLPLSDTCLFDTWIYVMSAALGRVSYLSEPLTLYRTHTTQTMGGEKQSAMTVADELSQHSASSDEAPRWREILDRLRQFSSEAENFASSEKILKAKLDFVMRRTRNRRRTLPGRALHTTSELVRGRYHRLGRGLWTYARDLYGNR